MLLAGRDLTDVREVDACSIRLASLHAVVARKRQMPHREDRHRLKLFVSRRELAGLQEPIAGLLDDIGHRHERIGIFPRIVHLGAQGTNLLLDLLMIFPGGALSLGWSADSLPPPRPHRLQHPLAAPPFPPLLPSLFPPP